STLSRITAPRILGGLFPSMARRAELFLLHPSSITRGGSFFGQRPQPPLGACSSAPKICSLKPRTQKGLSQVGPSRVIPVSLLTEHNGLIHFEEDLLDYRLRQSVPLQCLIIECLECHQHFELSERCLPKVLV